MKAIKLSLPVATIAYVPMPLVQGARSQNVKSLNTRNMKAGPAVSSQPKGTGGDSKVEVGRGEAPGTPKMTLLVTHLARGVASYPLHLEPHRMTHQKTLKSLVWTPHRLLSKIQWGVLVPPCHGMIR